MSAVQKAAAYAAGNGNSFDAARAAAEASANNLGRITAEMDRVLEAQPRPENAGANPGKRRRGRQRRLNA